MHFSIVVLVLTNALVTEVYHALNVTVTPGPIVMVTEKDNMTLSCLISQRKRSSSILILRWLFSPLAAPTLMPTPSSPTIAPPALEPSQVLIVKMGIKKMKLYGNYTRRFPQPKFRLYEETEGEVYRLRILNVTGMDQGFYTCRVQEIHKHRNTWKASSNGTSTTQLTGKCPAEEATQPQASLTCTDHRTRNTRADKDKQRKTRPTKGSRTGNPPKRCPRTVVLPGLCVGLADAEADSPFMTAVLIFQETMKLSAFLVHFTLEDTSSEGLWRLFADVYLCAVLICSLGLLSIFLFTLVLTCQYFHRRHRLKASYLLVKCPESSSGETVTSSSSSSSSSPRAQRKDIREKSIRRVTVTPPKPPEELPPHIQAKVSVAAKRPQKPRRLKTQPRKSATPRVSQEDNLTYAELELVRPRPEPPATSSPNTTPSSPDTVYAQILFQEKQL